MRLLVNERLECKPGSEPSCHAPLSLRELRWGIRAIPWTIKVGPLASRLPPTFPALRHPFGGLVIIRVEPFFAVFFMDDKMSDLRKGVHHVLMNQGVAKSLNEVRDGFAPGTSNQ